MAPPTQAVQQATGGLEGAHLHAGLLQGFEVALRQIDASDLVVTEVDAHTRAGALDQLEAQRGQRGVAAAAGVGVALEAAEAGDEIQGHGQVGEDDQREDPGDGALGRPPVQQRANGQGCAENMGQGNEDGGDHTQRETSRASMEIAWKSGWLGSSR